MPKQDFSSAEAVLQLALKRLGVGADLKRYKFTQHWGEIVGDAIARRSCPESLRNGVLKVRVCDSAWAQELTFHKGAILKRLKRFVADEEAPRDVQFYVGEV